MPGIRRFSKSIRRLDKIKEDVVQEFNGILGVSFKGEKYVEVPNREGYVYVRLRSNLNEVIQAYNSTVSPIYDLPVLVRRDKTYERYIVVGRDLGRYPDWGTSPYLPRHGAQHSFSDNNYGGDIVWVYDRQFVPLSISPSGTHGANNVTVNGDVLYWDGVWQFAGGTGSPNIFAYKPTGTTAKMVLVYIDTHMNPALLEGSSIFDPTVTGLSQIIPYLPSLSTTQGIPLGAVRLTSGTQRITWREIYDLRPLLNQANWASPYQVQDEGVTLSRRKYLNFKGATIWASDNAGADATDISISGSFMDGHVIEKSGYGYPQREYLNFLGDNVFVNDNTGTLTTDVVISGSPRHLIMATGALLGDGTYTDYPKIDFRSRSILWVTKNVGGDKFDVSVSGTHVIQSTSDPPTGTTVMFPGVLWLKKFA